MKKINLDLPALSPDGKPVVDQEKKPLHLGQFVSMALMQNTETPGPDVIKVFDWATKLYNKKPLDLDRADFDKFKGIISEIAGMQLLIKGQVLSVIGNWE